MIDTLKQIHAMNLKFLEHYKGTAEIIALLNNSNAMIENAIKENTIKEDAALTNVDHQGLTIKEGTK